MRDFYEETRMSQGRKVSLWARVAAWPLSALALIGSGVMLATGFVFTFEGAFVFLSGIFLLVMFVPVALRGTEPAWSTDPGRPFPGAGLFEAVLIAWFVAFQREALLRLSPAFIVLVGALCVLFFGGRILERWLRAELDLRWLLLLFLGLFTSPFWAAGLAPQSSWLDRSVGVLVCFFAVSATRAGVRWLRPRVTRRAAEAGLQDP
jgi:hypothetical protein